MGFACGCCGVGVLCENCIVDASIFLLSMLHVCGVWVEFFVFCKFCVCKIVCKCFVYLRALPAAFWVVGGVCCSCWVILFGYSGRTVDALACLADEGRVRLRYASGSCQQSVDPRMSEWGNLALVMECYLQMNV